MVVQLQQLLERGYGLQLPAAGRNAPSRSKTKHLYFFTSWRNSSGDARRLGGPTIAWSVIWFFPPGGGY